MKAEFVNQETPDVCITLSYDQAAKLRTVLLRVNGSAELDELWEALDDLVLHDPTGFKVVNQSFIEVTPDE